MIKSLRAAIYARFSSDLQSDASLDDQIRSCRDYAARQGLTVVESYTDRAMSGASLMRSGMQRLIHDAQSAKFDVIISEALDRLSRNQADIATIYQRFAFLDVMIETLSEGAISEMHIGLKGTMNALFLKDLAAKTHRGLKGRALAGKSAGGLTYGYRVVTTFTSGGEPIRGDRILDEIEAETVRRIFRDYARGISPAKIAEQLNIEMIPGPQGGEWGTSTVCGNRERGTGILNNEAYCGRQIWNRLRYVKDPVSGKRISRLNAVEDWVITEIPALRIVGQDLWDAVRSRQGALVSKGTDVAVWDRRRPRTLFSGLMECGCCGAGFSKVSKDGFGCSAARKKGKAICQNKTVIKQAELEVAVLDALAHHLMDDEAVAAFCAEYTAERNRLAAETSGNRKGLEKELAQVKRDHGKLVDAIIQGVPAAQVKDKMIELDGRRQTLETQLSSSTAVEPMRFHPTMGEEYRNKVAQLIKSLADDVEMEASKETLRALVEKIVLTPDQAGTGLLIDLHGALAGLLRLATGMSVYTPGPDTKAKNRRDEKSQAIDIIGELVLVAGAGFEPAAFRL
ncbi:MAG: recombinase family protein [Candidatus Saccharibacteria bacterium]|nr:recombinase family protein [Pseudorhodobacter sp.]